MNFKIDSLKVYPYWIIQDKRYKVASYQIYFKCRTFIGNKHKKLAMRFSFLIKATLGKKVLIRKIFTAALSFGMTFQIVFAKLFYALFTRP